MASATLPFGHDEDGRGKLCEPCASHAPDLERRPPEFVGIALQLSGSVDVRAACRRARQVRRPISEMESGAGGCKRGTKDVPSATHRCSRERVEDVAIRETHRNATFRAETVAGREGARGLQEPPNKRQRRSPFPLGWRDAPKFGRVIDDLIIPMKVPIGNDRSRMLPSEDRFTPELLVQECKRQQIDVGLVIDLTKSTSYYGPEEWTSLGVQHFKIPCQGRGQVPTPAEVNSFCFLVHWWQHQPGVCEGGGPPARKIAVHCTHGFNRSGYMIVHWLLRAHAPLTLPDAIRKFARYREPGIYKKYYIQELFDYFRVDVPVDMEVPKVPAWKAGDVEGAGDSDQDDDTAEEERPPRMDELHATGPLFGLVATDPDNIPLLQHDEVIGEEIMSDEEREIRRAVVALTRGQQVVDAMEEQGRLMFPGSQPVSLARSNVNLLSHLRYWVTWKADGTRYMMLLHHQGTYLIDRAFRVRRFHMRFPAWQEEVDARGRKRRTVYPSRGHPRTWRRHHLTLLDGELVVDQNAESMVPAEQQRRRYLIYDCMLLNGKSLLHLPFKERYKMIDEVTHPRQAERERIATDPSYPWRHCYDAEPFSVRRKDFWPLFQSRMVLEKLIESLSHESDGLIFQPFEGPYDCGTCNELLKWKFAHLNSVDFRLQFPPGAAEPELQVLQTRGGPPRLVKVAGARIRLSHEAPTPELLAQEEQVLREAYNGAIVECTYDAELESWVFHRVRSDKDTPNAQHVYQKVKQSIDDGIDNDEILRLVDTALQSEVYDRDRAKLKLPAKPRPRAPAPPPGPSSVPHRPLGLAPPDG